MKKLITKNLKFIKNSAVLLILMFFVSLINLFAIQNEKQIPKKTPVKQYVKSDDLLRYDDLFNKFGKNKILPTGFEIQALVALSHFPELKKEQIEFRFKKTKVAHTSSPAFFSVFKKANERKYIITISTKTKVGLEDTQLVNLSYNAQIGVLGHELAHIADYQALNFGGLLKFGLHYIKEKDIVATENRTDKITIQHGLGYQLWAWSNEVHELHIQDGRGDRYLSPGQIMALIDENLLYKNAVINE